MYRVFGLRLGPNFVMRLVMDKNIYLPLTVEKMHAFADFNDDYLHPHGCGDANSTATVNCINSKIEIKVKSLKYK